MTRALLMLVLLSGCFDIQFDDRAIIKTWRVLAMTVDRPEAAPGQDVSVSAMIVAPNGTRVVDPAASGVELRYSGCIQGDPAGALSGITFNPETRGAACDGSPMSLTIPQQDGVATIPGAITATVFERLEVLEVVYGDLVPPGTVQRVAETAGLPISVQLDVIDLASGEILVSAVKRFVLVQRDLLGTNPPPPRVQIGDHWVSARSGDPLLCTPEAEAPRVAPGSRVILTPDQGDDAWRETYWVLDLRGDLVEAREGAYYSFFSTGGGFSEGVTSAPAREEIWTAPKVPGDYPLFIVVRDGHAGVSACEARVIVE